MVVHSSDRASRRSYFLYGDNSPAALNGIVRGDKLIKIGSIDVVNTSNNAEINTINTTLFSPEINKEYSFTFETVDGYRKSVILKAADVATSPVRNAKVIEHNGKKSVTCNTTRSSQAHKHRSLTPLINWQKLRLMKLLSIYDTTAAV